MLNTQLDLPPPFDKCPVALQKFLKFEKMHMCTVSENREVHGGEFIWGARHSAYTGDANYPASSFSLVSLIGIWVSAEEAEFISLDSLEKDPFLTRVNQGISEYLFIIHPASTSFFSQILEKKGDSRFIIQALTLSSTRTLLAALPTDHESHHFLMVKTSYEESLGNVSRGVKKKESFGSVGNTFILGLHPVHNLNYFKDYAVTYLKDYDRGTLYRAIPEVLKGDQYTLIPFYSLFGINNREIFRQLTKNTHLTASKFIETRILKPLVQLIVTLLFKHGISIQPHAQNLLLKVHLEPFQLADSDLFYYRDAGGVNCIHDLQEKKELGLPEKLLPDDFYYLDTHLHDAAESIEYQLVGKLIYNLTKFFVKDQELQANDPDFQVWLKKMEKEGVLTNWTVFNKEDDDHQEVHSEESFFRYGYFEGIFGELLFNELESQGILREVFSAFPYLQDSYDSIKNTLDTKRHDHWFDPFIRSVYSHYIDCKVRRKVSLPSHQHKFFRV